ncbi:MAG: ABC transporter substrate-binding protein, partial [Bacilli bacterium]
MNKVISLISLIIILSLSGCNTKVERLFLLNWGDYINPDLLEEFENKYQVEVVLTEVESNEAMYEQLKLNRTSFDLAFPSDYMIQQMDQDGLLDDIDFSRLKNYNSNDFNHLSKTYGAQSNKYIPYFNGTIGLMYNTSNFSN